MNNTETKKWLSPDCYEENGIQYIMDFHGRSLEANHKGMRCQYKNLICQEGLCSNCCIFKDESNA